jgi:hypothetical protein
MTKFFMVLFGALLIVVTIVTALDLGVQERYVIDPSVRDGSAGHQRGGYRRGK